MTSRDYQLLVFDWDGTLMDSVGTIVHCMAEAFRRAGIEPLPDSRYRSIIGLGLQEALQALTPELPAHAFDAVAQHYRDCFLSAPHEAMPFFPAVEATLGELHARGYRLAVATGKSRRGLVRMFEHHAVCRLFTSSRCADESRSKPAPDMLLEIMAETGVAAERTLMVGDSIHDIRMARNAGVHGLGISHGVSSAEELRRHGALGCIHHFAELPAWLAGGKKQQVG
ncbi:MAG: HAD family hydrolase [Pseudomonadota bacterium]